MVKNKLCQIFLATKKTANMPVYNKRGILLLPKVIVLNPKDGILLIRFKMNPIHVMLLSGVTEVVLQVIGNIFNI